MRTASRVVINGRFLQKRMFGIGRYAGDLATALAAGPLRAEIWSPKGLHSAHDDMAGRGEVREFGPLHGHAWEQLTLPPRLMRSGRPLLVNFVNSAPLAYSNQVTVVYDVSPFRYPESFTWRYAAWYRAMLPRWISRSRRVITISEFVKAELVETFGIAPGCVDVVYPYLAPTFTAAIKSHETETREPFVLAVSSLSPRKNFARLIEAMRILEGTGIQLRVVGSRPKVFADPGLDLQLATLQNVRFLGPVDDATLAHLYRTATAFVYPSVYEGFGIPPIEAMAFGCPVVAARAAAIPETCGPAAEYVDPLDATDIARGISRVWDDGTYRSELASLGFNVAARYTLERSASRFEEILTSLI